MDHCRTARMGVFSVQQERFSSPTTATDHLLQCHCVIYYPHCCKEGPDKHGTQSVWRLEPLPRMVTAKMLETLFCKQKLLTSSVNITCWRLERIRCLLGDIHGTEGGDVQAECRFVWSWGTPISSLQQDSRLIELIGY